MAEEIANDVARALEDAAEEGSAINALYIRKLLVYHAFDTEDRNLWMSFGEDEDDLVNTWKKTFDVLHNQSEIVRNLSVKSGEKCTDTSSQLANAFSECFIRCMVAAIEAMQSMQILHSDGAHRELMLEDIPRILTMMWSLGVQPSDASIAFGVHKDYCRGAELIRERCCGKIAATINRVNEMEDEGKDDPYATDETIMMGNTFMDMLVTHNVQAVSSLSDERLWHFLNDFVKSSLNGWSELGKLMKVNEVAAQRYLEDGRVVLSVLSQCIAKKAPKTGSTAEEAGGEDGEGDEDDHSSYSGADSDTFELDEEEWRFSGRWRYEAAEQLLRATKHRRRNVRTVEEKPPAVGSSIYAIGPNGHWQRAVLLKSEPAFLGHGDPRAFVRFEKHGAVYLRSLLGVRHELTGRERFEYKKLKREEKQRQAEEERRKWHEEEAQRKTKGRWSKLSKLAGATAAANQALEEFQKHIADALFQSKMQLTDPEMVAKYQSYLWQERQKLAAKKRWQIVRNAVGKAARRQRGAKNRWVMLAYATSKKHDIQIVEGDAERSLQWTARQQLLPKMSIIMKASLVPGALLLIVGVILTCIPRAEGEEGIPPAIFFGVFLLLGGLVFFVLSAMAWKLRKELLEDIEDDDPDANKKDGKKRNSEADDKGHGTASWALW